MEAARTSLIMVKLSIVFLSLSLTKMLILGVLKVVEKCPNLSSLSFSRTNITDETLVKLSVSDCKSSLTELNVSGCRFITDQGVEMFLTGLQSMDQPPVLNILVLHKCPLLTEVSTELINQFFCDNNVKVKQLSWTIS